MGEWLTGKRVQIIKVNIIRTDALQDFGAIFSRFVAIFSNTQEFQRPVMGIAYALFSTGISKPLVRALCRSQHYATTERGKNK